MDAPLTFIADLNRHLVCVPYSPDNLHRMAETLGIKRCWFHGNHYDIPWRRRREIFDKCKLVSSRQIVRIIRAWHGQQQKLNLQSR